MGASQDRSDVSALMDHITTVFAPLDVKLADLQRATGASAVQVGKLTTAVEAQGREIRDLKTCSDDMRKSVGAMPEAMNVALDRHVRDWHQREDATGRVVLPHQLEVPNGSMPGPRIDIATGLKWAAIIGTLIGALVAAAIGGHSLAAGFAIPDASAAPVSPVTAAD